MYLYLMYVVLLMPDHLHLVVTPHLGRGITELVRSWKRHLARAYRVPFQRNFFEHRIRSHENFQAHCLYVWLNPVRAGLVNRPEDWPWVYPILEGKCSDLSPTALALAVSSRDLERYGGDCVFWSGQPVAPV